MYMKNITESQDRQNFERLHMLFVICTVLHENALVFSQSEEGNFFMYIIINVFWMIA